MQTDFWILVGLGGLFILLGLGAFLWGRSEEKSYYQAISTRADVREYVEHTPLRPEAGALKVGGFITVAIGLVLLVMGLVWLLG